MEEKRSKKALYREYRSMSFDEVIGQKHITDTLKKAVKNGSISHAYLFTGPRGVGKTSVARILAYEINNQKYDHDSSHIDIIEIDAASNRGIDEIRDLREKVRLAPTSLQYKVYIIDEVHMLTTPAFNALLKTLEEPPAHIVFILATTEVHKLPETIISRTQRFSFHPIGLTDMKNQLRTIANIENIQIDDTALELIAKHGRGSLRDSISIFDQLSGYKDTKISYETVLNALGMANDELIAKIIEAVNLHQPESIASLIRSSALISLSAPTVAYQLIDVLRSSDYISRISSISLIEDLMEVSTSYDPALKLEAVLIRHCFVNESAQANIQSVNKPPIISVRPSKIIAKELPKTHQIQAFNDESWREILSRIKITNNSLHAVLRMALPAESDDAKTIVLKFKFLFHKQRADEAKNKLLLENIIQDILGQRYSVRVLVDQEAEKPTHKQVDHLKNAITVMGGGEIMEYHDE